MCELWAPQGRTLRQYSMLIGATLLGNSSGKAALAQSYEGYAARFLHQPAKAGFAGTSPWLQPPGVGGRRYSLISAKKSSVVRKRNLLACARHHAVRFDTLGERALAERVEASIPTRRLRCQTNQPPVCTTAQYNNPTQVVESGGLKPPRLFICEACLRRLSMRRRMPSYPIARG